MASSFVASRAQIIYAFCLPLAVLLGYLLADPMDTSSMAIVVLVVSVLAVPVLMHWYHPLLIFSWNAAITPYLLPGQPYLWMLLAFVGLGFALLNRFTSPEARFVSVPTLTRPLLFLLLVVAVTAWLRGGFGIRTMGAGQYGGKGYFYLTAAVLGYFALTSQRIPTQKAGLFVGLFFISGLTSLVPNLAYLAGSKFEFLYYIFPPGYAAEQATTDENMGLGFGRLFGLTLGSNALYCWLLAQYGLRGLFDSGRPWRLALFLAAALGCLFCGFRSFMVLFVLTLAAQFYFEGLCRMRTIMGLVAALVVSAAVVIPNLERMPMVVQRTLSFLPIGVSSEVRASAQMSTEWRFHMWQELLDDVPGYLLKGKGYSIDPTDMSFAVENARRGYGASYRWAMVGGSYHNGPLTLLIPLGIWGVIAFTWFVGASVRYLYRHFRYGAPELRTVNLFILSYFIARLVHYCLVFGMFSNDLFLFTGLIGVSVSLNGAAVPAQADVEQETEELALDEELASQRR